jgi:hypothetical protein
MMMNDDCYSRVVIPCIIIRIPSYYDAAVVLACATIECIDDDDDDDDTCIINLSPLHFTSNLATMQVDHHHHDDTSYLCVSSFT